MIPGTKLENSNTNEALCHLSHFPGPGCVTGIGGQFFSSNECSLSSYSYFSIRSPWHKTTKKASTGRGGSSLMNLGDANTPLQWSELESQLYALASSHILGL